jgi:hypothetical protein
MHTPRRDFEGSWQVQPVAAGTCSESPAVADAMLPGGGCVITHTLSVQPLIPVPPPFSYYTSSIFVKQVEGVLRDLETELLRRRQQKRVASGDPALAEDMPAPNSN